MYIWYVHKYQMTHSFKCLRLCIVPLKLLWSSTVTYDCVNIWNIIFSFMDIAIPLHSSKSTNYMRCSHGFLLRACNILFQCMWLLCCPLIRFCLCVCSSTFSLISSHIVSSLVWCPVIVSFLAKSRFLMPDLALELSSDWWLFGNKDFAVFVWQPKKCKQPFTFGLSSWDHSFVLCFGLLIFFGLFVVCQTNQYDNVLHPGFMVSHTNGGWYLTYCLLITFAATLDTCIHWKLLLATKSLRSYVAMLHHVSTSKSKHVRYLMLHLPTGHNGRLHITNTTSHLDVGIPKY